MSQHDFAVCAQAAARDLAQPRPMRRGAVSVRKIRCHKPGCACATDPDRRHGPYVSLVQGGGKNTKSRWVPAATESLVRQQVSEGKAFQDRVENFFRTCEQWADAELEAAQAASQEAVEKKGFTKRFKRRSRKKSKR